MKNLLLTMVITVAFFQTAKADILENDHGWASFKEMFFKSGKPIVVSREIVVGEEDDDDDNEDSYVEAGKQVLLTDICTFSVNKNSDGSISAEEIAKGRKSCSQFISGK